MPKYNRVNPLGKASLTSNRIELLYLKSKKHTILMLRLSLGHVLLLSQAKVLRYEHQFNIWRPSSLLNEQLTVKEIDRGVKQLTT